MNDKPTKSTTDAKWCRASLRVSSTTCSAAEIARVIGVEPTAQAEKGEPYSARYPEAKRREALCTYSSGLSRERSMEEHLGVLAEFIEAHADALAALGTDCRLEYFCGFASSNGQGGFTLSPELLNRLLRVPIELTLDLYPPSGAEDDAKAH
jgi:hypothetical protein